MGNRTRRDDAPSNFLFKFLRTSAGSEDMATTAGVYQYTVPDGKTAEIFRVNFQIVDGGITYNEFGGLGAVLTNGIKIEIIDQDTTTVILDFLDGETIKANEHFAALSGVDAALDLAAGDDALLVRWSISKAGDNHGVVLQAGEILRVTTQDDLTNLTVFQAMVQGKVFS